MVKCGSKEKRYTSMLPYSTALILVFDKYPGSTPVYIITKTVFPGKVKRYPDIFVSSIQAGENSIANLDIIRQSGLDQNWDETDYRKLHSSDRLHRFALLSLI
jgi:hypothetical protein